VGTGTERNLAFVVWQRRGIEMATVGTALVLLPYQSSISGLSISPRHQPQQQARSRRFASAEFGNSVRGMDVEKRLVGVMDFVRLYFL